MGANNSGTSKSLVVGDPEKELEREDPVEPEPVPDVEPEKEKTSVASGSR